MTTTTTEPRTSERYSELPEPNAKPGRWWSDADLDAATMKPTDHLDDFVRSTLAEFASRWNGPHTDAVTLGLDRDDREDSPERFTELRWAIRAATPRIRYRALIADPIHPDPLSVPVDPEIAVARLRVLSDLDLEEPALARDWANPEMEARWDGLVIAGHEHATILEDLMDQMLSVDHDRPLTEDQARTAARVYGSNAVDTVEGPRPIQTVGELMDRTARFQWDDDYFANKQVQTAAQVGRIYTGGFVTYPNGDRFAACVVQAWRSSPSGLAPRFTVYWREDLGQIVARTAWGKKRTVRVWQYHRYLHCTDRTEALALAHRLTTVARNDASMERDAWGSMNGARGTDPDWWQNEAPWDPSILVSKVGREESQEAPE